MKQWLVLIMATLFVAGSHAATLEGWQFNDANGTALNAVTNTGTVGTSWNFGGPRTRTGNLNIGDDVFYSWDPGTGITTRKATFASALTSGKYVFEFVVADWDMAGTDGIGTTGNGIKFNVGDNAGSMMQLEFEVAALGGVSTNIANDIRVRSQNSNNGSLSGSNVESTLGGLDLTNTAPVTVQLIADLDTGDWSTKVDFGSGFVDLVTAGTGMTTINEIQLLIDSSNGTGWEYAGVNGTALEFIKIDSITLSEQEVVVPDPWPKLEYFELNDAAGLAFGPDWVNSGTLGSRWNFGGPATIATDGAGSLLVSNHTGQVFRKLPKAGTANADAALDQYATPLADGKYRLELDLASWSLDPAAIGSTMSLQLRPTAASGTTAGMTLKVQDASTARMQMYYDSTTAGGQNNFRNVDFPLTNSTAQSFAIVLDYGLGTVEYFTNGVAYSTSYEPFNTNTAVGTLQFNTSGTWVPGHVVAINALGFSQFNEAAVPVLAVDFNQAQVSSGIQYEYYDFALDLGSPRAELPNYSGQPIYAGLELDPVSGKITGIDDGGAYTNGGAISFGSNGGAKLAWNGPFSNPPVVGADLGRYEEDDVATGVFLFKKADFLNGLDAGTVFMNATNDTLSATVRLETKENDPTYPLKRLKSGQFRWVVQDAGSFYISAEVTNMTSDTGSIDLTAEAQEISWFDYDPLVNVTNLTTAASPTLQDIDALGFWMSATVLTNDGIRRYPNIQCSSFEAQAGVAPVAGPVGLWDEWIGGFSVGSDTGFLAHADSDDLDNLTEYAFGGDPSDGGSQGNTPVQSQGVDSGTNYLEYVYFERTDAVARGLAYLLTTETDLVAGSGWVDDNYEVVGTNTNTGIDGFNAVTNRISTAGAAKQFIRLQIQFTP